MNEVAIIYSSVHHQNTKRLIDALAAEFPIDVFTADEAKNINLCSYSLIGIASGIYYGKCHASLFKVLKESRKLPPKGFVICTSGAVRKSYEKYMAGLLKEKGVEVIGTFQCAGHNTYGPFKLIGGLRKGHPNDADIENAKAFMKRVL